MRLNQAALKIGLLLSLIPQDASATCSWQGLTGEWKSNDGGIYHVRQLGNDVWWVGLSPDGGKQYTNAFRGVMKNTAISGSWVDVRGALGARGFGTLDLQVGGAQSFRKVASGGGPFGAIHWTRECQTTVVVPGK